MGNKFLTLIGYGLKILSESRKEPTFTFDDYPPPENDWISAYESTIGKNGVNIELLSNIFSFVSLDKTKTPPLTYVSPIPFKLDDQNFTANTSVEAKSLLSTTDWGKFSIEFQALGHLTNFSDEQLFEGFFHLFRKWTSGLPGTCGGEGISLFEQWKTIAALVFATGDDWERGPGESFTLIGGDIPGIQDFVYTITSRGATRGLRGRSYFIQLLGDAVVHRLITEFGLSSVNIIYAVGGNFMLLAPTAINEKLQKISEELERSLLHSFEGDLAICLASEPINLQQIRTSEFSNPVSRSLKEKIAAQKQRRYSFVATSEWSSLFAPQGKPGNKHCEICQRMLGLKEGIEIQDDESGEEPSYRCKACDGFQQLARDLADATSIVLTTNKPKSTQHWQEALFNICGKYYLLYDGNYTPSQQDWVYLLNDPDFSGKAHGYRLLANTTPKVTKEDLTEHKEDIEKGAHAGDIRTFSLLATLSKGFKKVGVLRMDVDNLGSIMAFGLTERNMVSTSTLSSALDRFFTGWLNTICTQVNEGNERLYTIYAGGDDLFVVGSWDLMPVLADRIRSDFSRYTGNNPSLHISAGISLEDRKFPLYQAADRAGEAEQKAKDHVREIPASANATPMQEPELEKKNAITFLGVACKWDQWELVKDYHEIIIELIKTYEIPQALNQLIQDIYNQYQQQVLDAKKKKVKSHQKIVYGPWIWRAAYGLTRLSKRSGKQEVDKMIRKLLTACQKPETLEFVALASRWAEFERREEKSNG